MQSIWAQLMNAMVHTFCLSLYNATALCSSEWTELSGNRTL